MSDEQNRSSPEGIGVSLVNGDPTVRHARQLLLRSERYDVRSYPTSAALLADPRSRHCACIVLDLAREGIDGVDVLRQMRASGWRGKALVLDGPEPGDAIRQEAEQHGDKVLQHTIGDQTLLTAIANAIDRSGSAWDARG